METPKVEVSFGVRVREPQYGVGSYYDDDPMPPVPQREPDTPVESVWYNWAKEDAPTQEQPAEPAGKAASNWMLEYMMRGDLDPQ